MKNKRLLAVLVLLQLCLCYGQEKMSSLNGRWRFSQGFIDFNEKKSTFKFLNPYIETDSWGKYTTFEAVILSFKIDDQEFDFTGIFRKDGSLLLNIKGDETKLESYIPFYGGKGRNAYTLDGTWELQSGKKRMSFSFVSDSNSVEIVMGETSLIGTYSAKAMIMLELRLYEDSFSSDGYTILMLLEMIDAKTFIADNITYRKVF